MQVVKDYVLSPSAITKTSGSSKGTQLKYFDHGYWYKANTVGYEGTSEYLASLVLSCSNIDNFVTYEKCTINGRPGCRSENFLGGNESFVSIQRLYDLYHGGQLNDKIRILSEVRGRIDFIVNFMKEVTELDLTEYLGKMLSFDALILNTDRHFHNIGVVYNSDTNEYKEAPFFDHGNSLLSNYAEFPIDTPMNEAISSVSGKPFASSLEYQAHCLSYGLKIDYSKLQELLKDEPETRALQVLCKQLEYYRDRFDCSMQIKSF